MVEVQTAGQAQEDKPADVVASNSNMLQHIVTEAVKKVLADQEVTDTENIVSQVVEGLKPTLVSSSASSIRNATPNIGKHIAIPPSITRPAACVYNPTPIAELKKRHIPVISYMPTRESRVAVKRKPSPERAKLWLNDVKESSSSQQPEVTYKPTAIVNSIDQDTVQNYVPTVKSDLLLSNSYEDSNSNDYQSKFKEEYYPKSKKRREEYVPKKIKTPLKTVQQLNDTTLNQFEPEFDMIDEILTTSHTAPDALEHVKASTSEDSQDYSLEMESKFSDDESIEDISKDEDKESVKKAEQIEDVNEKEKENLQHARSDTVDKQMSNKDKIHSNHYDIKKGDTQTSDRSKQHKANRASESSDKKEDSIKENTDKDKEKRKDHSKSREKNRKDYHNSSKDKERYKHKSDSRDKHGSSSSRNKDKIRSSRDSKDSLRSSKEHSDSRKHRRASPKKERNNHHKSSRHDKHKSTSNSSSSKSHKHTSSKSDRKHRSESSRRSSDSSRKYSKYKESSSEKNSSDLSDDAENNFHTFLDDESLDLLDSDHDSDYVQEECLRIFQVNMKTQFYNMYNMLQM